MASGTRSGRVRGRVVRCRGRGIRFRGRDSLSAWRLRCRDVDRHSVHLTHGRMGTRHGRLVVMRLLVFRAWAAIWRDKLRLGGRKL